jgi:hypothetical protein
MALSFDIFRADPDGSMMWQGTEQTLEGARSYVRRVETASPGKYVIMNLQTKQQFSIDENGSGEEREGQTAANVS